MTELDVIVLVGTAGISSLVGAVFLWLLFRYLRRVRIALIKDAEPKGIDVEIVLLREVARAQQETRPGQLLASRFRARRAAWMAALIRRDKEEM